MFKFRLGSLIIHVTLFLANWYADLFSSVGLLIHFCNSFLHYAIALLILIAFNYVICDLSLKSVSGANFLTHSIFGQCKMIQV